LHVGQYLGSTALSSVHLYPHFKHIHSAKSSSPETIFQNHCLSTLKHLNLYLQTQTVMRAQ